LAFFSISPRHFLQTFPSPLNNFSEKVSTEILDHKIVLLCFPCQWQARSEPLVCVHCSDCTLTGNLSSDSSLPVGALTNFPSQIESTCCFGLQCAFTFLALNLGLRQGAAGPGQQRRLNGPVPDVCHQSAQLIMCSHILQIFHV
jgi:hypothetical protein